jgi:hypothetical protein
MRAFILFTKSDKIGSKMIREVTREPVSHCAVYVPSMGFVWHSTIPKVEAVAYPQFIKKCDVVYSVEVDITGEQLNAIREIHGKAYDYLSFFMVGFRILMRKIGLWVPKVDLRGLSSVYLCTELVERAVGIPNNPYITPYKLYRMIHES